MKKGDAHIHLGKNWGSSGYAIAEERLSDLMRENSVSKALVFPQPRPDPYNSTSGRPFVPSAANDRVGLYAETEGRALPVCYLDHRHPGASLELERCVKRYDVRAVKLHPGLNLSEGERGLAFAPANGLLDTVQDYSLFVVTHPAPYDTFGLLETIKKHEETDFVVAHLAFLSPFMLMAASSQENLYLDTSAITSRNLRRHINEEEPSSYVKIAIKHAGREKVVFGSDVPWSKWEDELDAALGGGADEKVFHGNLERLLRG